MKNKKLQNTMGTTLGIILGIGVTAALMGCNNTLESRWQPEFPPDVIIDPSSPENEVPVTAVTVKDIKISIGETAEVHGTLYPANATIKRIYWKIEDMSIAGVQNGRVIGLK